MKFGLTHRQLKELIEILRSFPAIKTCYVFGSRACDNFYLGSDIDLALIFKNNDSQLLGRISNAFEDSTIPLFVDLVDYNDISDDRFKKIIDQHKIKIYCEKTDILCH